MNIGAELRRLSERHNLRKLQHLRLVKLDDLLSQIDVLGVCYIVDVRGEEFYSPNF